MKFCSVTILYKPSNDFCNHLRTYSGFVERTIIVDNTPGGISSEFLEEIRLAAGSSNLIYIGDGINHGIATALNKGFKEAQQSGFSHVLTMDQDSYFENGIFFEKASELIHQPNLGIIAASYGGKMPFKKNVINDFEEVLFTITSGNIVSVDAWEKCGRFDEKLFIDEVDHDFCLRLKLHCFKVVTSIDVLLKHKLGNSYSIKTPFSGQKKEIGIHNPTRIFFMVRNGLYVSKKYFFLSPTFCLNRIKHLLVKFILIICVYPNRRQYLRQYYLGVRRFISSDYNNISIS